MVPKSIWQQVSSTVKEKDLDRKKEMVEATIKLLEKMPEEKNPLKLALAYKLKKEIAKEYPDRRAMESVNRINCFIRKIEPAVETIVVC